MRTDLNKYLQEFNTYLNNERFNSNTKLNYRKYIRQFLAVQSTSIDGYNENEIISYLINKIEAENLSDYKRQMLFGAFKVFFNDIVGMDYKLLVIAQLYPINKIPVVLDKEEIKKIFEFTKNLKHKVIFMLAYYCGLKPTDVLHLKLNDINVKEKIIILNNKNGEFMRNLQLSDELLIHIKDYRNLYLPQIWLFEGECEQMYNNRSVEMAFKKVMLRVKINKKATLHTLRHSFAVHLLEGGIDINIIQTILGLKNKRSTNIYSQLSKCINIDILGTLGNIEMA